MERRGAARYAWNHALLQLGDSAPRGQVLVDIFGQAIERSARLLGANPSANWLLVVAKDEYVRGCNDFLAERLGSWPRVNCGRV